MKIDTKDVLTLQNAILNFCYQKQEGGYRLSEMICQAVHQWWSGVQVSTVWKTLFITCSIYYSFKYLNKRGFFFPLPLNDVITMTLKYTLLPILNIFRCKNTQTHNIRPEERNVPAFSTKIKMPVNIKEQLITLHMIAGLPSYYVHNVQLFLSLPHGL